MCTGQEGSRWDIDSSVGRLKIRDVVDAGQEQGKIQASVMTRCGDDWESGVAEKN